MLALVQVSLLRSILKTGIIQTQTTKTGKKKAKAREKGKNHGSGLELCLRQSASKESRGKNEAKKGKKKHARKPTRVAVRSSLKNR